MKKTNENTKSFESDYLPYVATAAITGKVEIVVKIHPEAKYPGHKVFFITPYETALHIYEKFLGDVYKISPRLIAAKIMELKNLPIQETTPQKENGLTGG